MIRPLAAVLGALLTACIVSCVVDRIRLWEDEA
jgi:hypothetical protein